MPFAPGLARTARGLARRPGFAVGAIPLGFEPRGVLTAEVVFPESRYDTRPTQTRAVTEIVRPEKVRRAAAPQRFNARVVSLGLVAAGASASLVPALRGARLDPAAILREP